MTSTASGTGRTSTTSGSAAVGATPSSGGVEQPVPVLIFDGDCGFCTTSARWAERRFDIEHVEPWQSLDLEAFGITSQECERAAQYVRRDGRVFAGELAFAEALIEHGGRWGRVGRLMRAPGVRQLGGVVYRLIARNRHRLPGSTDACRIPQA